MEKFFVTFILLKKVHVPIIGLATRDELVMDHGRFLSTNIILDQTETRILMHEVSIRCKSDSLTSHSSTDLQISRRRRRCSSVRACDTQASSLFVTPIASKCQEIVCGASKSTTSSSCTIDVDWVSTFCRKCGPYYIALDD
ncbi:hypothetical protein TNCV_2327811 [Trichonephila clavipes]|nr:hypothetical protein TNCV_2327811 [Trichonephila clavipes]